jgi:hypothetical protein
MRQAPAARLTVRALALQEARKVLQHHIPTVTREWVEECIRQKAQVCVCVCGGGDAQLLGVLAVQQAVLPAAPASAASTAKPVLAL